MTICADKITLSDFVPQALSTGCPNKPCNVVRLLHTVEWCLPSISTADCCCVVASLVSAVMLVDVRSLLLSVFVSHIQSR